MIWYGMVWYGMVWYDSFVSVRSEVEAINQNAVQLYRKFGFETRDKNPNKRSNNVFMAKELYKWESNQIVLKSTSKCVTDSESNK